MRAKRSARATWVLLLVLTAAAPADAADPPTPPPADSEAQAPAGSEAQAPAGSEAPAPADPDLSVPVIGSGWPVGVRPPILRGWEPPATRYGRGHRGVDLQAPPGAPVRAVAPGRVSYAGRVAGKGVVSLELRGTGDPPLRTTYQPVHASVRKGDEVAAGEVIGTTEASGSHCGTPCLHWGLRRGGTYLDPLSLLPPWLLRRGPARLLPVLGVPLPA